MGHKEEFIGFLTRSVGEMPQDVKVLLEMFDDPEFEDESRLRAAGALIYLIAPGDIIPDTFGLLGQVDDSLVLRMTMAHLLEVAPSRADHYRERYPEIFDTLEQDLESAEKYLGDVYPWMKQWLDRLSTLEYKGKIASSMLDDVDEGSWLYDELNEALLDLEFDDDDLNRELRRVDRILPVMQEKMDIERR